MATMNKDFQPENWWTAPTISGGGTYDTTSGTDGFWWEDKDRHRSGKIEHTSTEYGTVDMYNHSGSNQPVDVYLGRKKSVRDRDLDSGLYPGHK